MKTQLGNKVARTDGRMAAWRAALSRAFHTQPGYQASHPAEKLADLVVDEGLQNELSGLIAQLQRRSEPANPSTKAILVTGEAGTGKTLLVRALAGEANRPLYSLRLPDAGSQDFSRLVQQVRAAAPAVVLLEGLDELWQAEAAGPEHQPAARICAEIRRLAATPHVLLLGTAISIEQVPADLLRPGSFERQIHLGLPDRHTRQQILANLTRRLTLTKDVNLGMIARATSGFSGGDLAQMCRQADEYSASRGSSQISMTDFEQAVEQALLACAGKTIVNEQTRRILAYHEAGHALAAWLNPAVEPIRRVSLLRRWQITFRPEALPGYEQAGISKDYLLALLAVLLAGRAGEEVGVGEITTGAENDLAEATGLARRMVSRWGMGRLGPVAFDQLATQEPCAAGEPTYSETTAARIDQDVQELLKSQYQAVSRQLQEARPALDQLAETLLDDETVDQKEMARIFGPRPLHGSGENNLPILPDEERSL